MKINLRNIFSIVVLGLWVVSGEVSLNAAPFSLQGAGYGINVSYIHGVNDIKRGTNETWDDVVNAFNVNTFVSDVVATGAPFVVFSLGQTNGFYCSPNDKFNFYTGCRTGEYTSTRDLILEVAKALKTKNIALFVYMDAVGPSGAQAYTRADGTSADPIGGLDVDGQARSSTFQARYQEMIKLWSARWAGNVAGWWLDGCWVAGYRENPVLGYPGTSGPTNLNNLIAACKFGNLDAIVACNPSSGVYDGMSGAANYLCGEDEWLNKYPASQFVYTNGSNLQWNTTIYLGKTWGESSTRFYNEQIAAYVKNVNNRGGSVMLDIGIYRNGSLSTTQKAQMGYVYSRVRNNVALTSYTDLARYKSVWMQNSSGTELAVNGAGYFHYAGYGNDGESDARVALPGGAYDWQYVVDLGQNTTVRRSVVTFPQGLFATSFSIQGSTNSTTWITLATYALTQAQITTNKAQSSAYNIALPANIQMPNPRFVRLKAIAPNAPNQTGNQMAVQAFELYAN
jgi:hypothetical protein